MLRMCWVSFTFDVRRVSFMLRMCRMSLTWVMCRANPMLVMWIVSFILGIGKVSLLLSMWMVSPELSPIRPGRSETWPARALKELISRTIGVKFTSSWSAPSHPTAPPPPACHAPPSHLETGHLWNIKIFVGKILSLMGVMPWPLPGVYRQLTPSGFSGLSYVVSIHTGVLTYMYCSKYSKLFML
jgi:hypothetical protein